MQRLFCSIAQCLLVLTASGCLLATQVDVIQPGQHLDKTPAFPDSRGGLNTATNLTGVLNFASFGMSDVLNVSPVGRCFGSGDTDECAKVDSTWSIFEATYTDNQANPVNICLCGGTPFEHNDFALALAHVSHKFVVLSCTLNGHYCFLQRRTLGQVLTLLMYAIPACAPET